MAMVSVTAIRQRAAETDSRLNLKSQIPNPKSQRRPPQHTKPQTPTLVRGVWDLVFGIWDLSYFSVASRPSTGAPVPDDPTNSFLPSGKVISRPLARIDPSLAWKPSTEISVPSG